MRQRPLVAVVGGGIAGLAAAHELAVDTDVVVFEAEGRLGGRLATTTFRGRPLDLGADAFIVRNPAAADLCDELGIGADLIEPSTRAAAIFTRGALRPLPGDLVLGVPTRLGPLARSGTVGPAGVARAALDLVARRPVLSAAELAGIVAGRRDPTVAEVLGPRLGTRVLGGIVDPLVGGINASDVDRLSLYSAMTQVAEAAPDRRSLMRALRRAPGPAAVPGAIFRGLAGGIGELVDALSASLAARGVELREEAVAEVGPRSGGGFAVRTAATVLEVDGVILTTPAYVTAALLAGAAPEAAAELAAIPYASVATVTSAFRAGDVPTAVGRALRSIAGSPGPDGGAGARILPGSGVLVARDRRRLITAASFTSSKWPRSANEGEVVIRCSLGRHGDDRADTLGDDELLGGTARDLEAVLGIRADPLEVRLERFPRSFPQYVSGHRARVARLDRLAGALGVELAGAALGGIGIPACVASGRGAAGRLRARLSP